MSCACSNIQQLIRQPIQPKFTRRVSIPSSLEETMACMVSSLRNAMVLSVSILTRKKNEKSAPSVFLCVLHRYRILSCSKMWLDSSHQIISDSTCICSKNGVKIFFHFQKIKIKNFRHLHGIIYKFVHIISFSDT